MICARTQSQLDEVSKAVEAAGRRAVALCLNAAAHDTPAALVAAAEKEFGRLDIVVNNVGGSMPTPFLDTTPKMFNEAFQFNVTTAFSLTQQATPLLLRSPGASVINITSTMGRVRDRGYVAYGTAKAALIHMTHLLAADLAPRIRVNAISPGSIATSALEIVSGSPELKAELESKTPLGRIGVPEGDRDGGALPRFGRGRVRHRQGARRRRRDRGRQPQHETARPRTLTQLLKLSSASRQPRPDDDAGSTS